MSSEGAEYSLNWDGHVQHIRKAFTRFLQTNELCDVTLYAEGQKIKAHKVFLSACSKYFDQLFKDFKDERPVVVLKGVQFHILKHILNFVYNGEAHVQTNQLNQFLETAAFLKIDGLTENHMKRKRISSIASESDNISIDCEEHSRSNVQTKTAKKQSWSHVSPKPSKLLKIINAPNREKETFSIYSTDFAKTPEIGKYSINSPKRVGAWLSEYELESQSSFVESQSLLDEHTDDPLIGQDISQREDILEASNIKTEPTTKKDLEVEEIIFDQNDFANSLDVEIEIVDDGDEDLLDQLLMNTYLTDKDEEGLYQCKICTKSYMKKDSLKKHFAVHINNTTCVICGKMLSRKTHLIRHLRIHNICLK